MNRRKISRTIVWVISGLLIIGLGGIGYMWYSVDQVGKLVAAGFRYNMQSPHASIYRELIHAYSGLFGTRFRRYSAA